MHKQFKRLVIGVLGAFAICWASAAFAWTSDSDQRGWVDSIVWHTGFVIGPTPQVEISGWACLNPKYGITATSTNVQVFQGTKQLTITSAFVVNRQDVVNAGSCANLNNGFSLGVQGADKNLPNKFTVVFLGGFAPIVLEGQTVATINNIN